mmetsp:Transcript_100089/g.311855  ORF Transcript_100089/g.311855 Transcript_100089/m.311855 type:complete len:375 (-) Transcript_100089:536-1660(-)
MRAQLTGPAQPLDDIDDRGLMQRLQQEGRGLVLAERCSRGLLACCRTARRSAGARPRLLLCGLRGPPGRRRRLRGLQGPVAAPVEDDLVLALTIQGERPGPLSLQDGNVLTLLRAVAIAIGHCTTLIRGVLHVQEEAVAAQSGAMPCKMGGREIVVFLERHRGVEAARRPVRHEEVAQDEVAVGALVLADGLRCVRRREDAAEPSPEARAAHAREEELRRAEGREVVALGAGHRGVGLGEVAAPRLELRAGDVLPPGDVVADLHADLALSLGVVQCHVPRRCELSPHDGVKAQSSVVLDARRVDVPRRSHLHAPEVRLHQHDVMRPLRRLGTPRRDDAEVEGTRWNDVLSFFSRERVPEELLVQPGPQLRLDAP